METGLYINSRITLPPGELRESFVRSGGAGGQHVNKTSTKVELRWSPATSNALAEHDRQRLLSRLRLTADGDVVVTSDRERDQFSNRRDARRKLAALIRDALHRRPTRVSTRPSRASVERRLEAKRQRSAVKRDRRGSADSDDGQ
jgi:ribosome-associated protein